MVHLARYQILGDLIINFQKRGDVVATDYRRDLNLVQGISSTTFRRDSSAQAREVFVSKPDEVIVVHIKATGAEKVCKAGGFGFQAGD